MQIPVISPRGQKKPWTSIPRINWAHPLANKLAYYGYDTGAGIVDLVANGQLTFTTGTLPSTAVSKFGIGRKWTSGGAGTTSVITFNKPAGNYTIACAWLITALPSIAFTAPFGINSQSGNSLANFLWDQTVNTDVQFSVGGANPTPVSGFNSTNVFHTLIGVSTSAASQILYGDGKQISTSALTDNSQVTQNVNFNGLAGNTTTPSLNGVAGWIYYGAYWTRQLTPLEAAQLHQDPYCFLIYPEDEIFATWVGVTTANTRSAGWYQPLGIAPRVPAVQLGSSFVPFNTPQVTISVPQGWESINSAAPALAFVNASTLTFVVPPPIIPRGWQSIVTLAPAVAAPQPGYSFVPFNTAQTNTATIDKWQQPLSIPVLAPPVQLGASFVPFNTFQINTAPLGWYQALASTPSAPLAQQGATSLSYNIAPTINTIAGTGWYQALAATPPAPLSQIGAAFVPFNTPQTVTTVSPYGWYQPLSLAPAVATATYTQPTWIAAPFPTFTLAWQQPLASTPAPASLAAQIGSTSLSYNIQPLANTVVGMPWQQPLATAVPVAIAYQSQFFVPYNTAQVIVVTTIQHSNPFMATVGAMTCIN